MRDTGTLRVDAGALAPESSRNRDGPPLALDDGAGNRIVVQAVHGSLLVRGEGDVALTIRKGRLSPFTRKVALDGAPVELAQGMRLSLRAGEAGARLTYDPDGLLPLPLRVAAFMARNVDMPLPTAAMGACAVMGLLSLASVYYGGTPGGGMPVELARHRAADGYPKLDYKQADWLAERSPFFVKVAERRKAEREKAEAGDAR